MNLPVKPHPDEVKAAFRDWCAVPTKERNPPTLKAWCELFDVERTTTWKWRQDHAFRMAVAERVRAKILPRLPDMLEVAVQKALEGSYKHLELLLRHVIEVWNYVPQDKVVTTKAEAGQGLLQAIQSGRLAEQLGAMVAAGREAQARAKEEQQNASIEGFGFAVIQDGDKPGGTG